jgi:hypothetical protein
MNKNKLTFLKLLILVDILKNSKLKLAKNLFHHELWNRFLIGKERVINSIFSSGHSSIYKYYRDQNYEMVVKIISSLDESKLNSSMLKILAISNLALGNHEEHSRILQLAFEKRTKMSLSDFINQLSISNNNNISSSYAVGVGGAENLGVIIHFRNNKPIYLTKIKDMSHQGNKIHTERFFYEDLCSLYPSLVTFTPKFIDYLELKKPNVSAITIEYIQGHNSTLEDFTILLDVQKKLMSLDIQPLLINSQIMINLSRRYLYTSINFWKFLINNIESSLNYSLESKPVSNVRLLREIFIKSKFYKSFDTDILYVIQHLDFAGGNIIINENKNSAFVIDWGRISIALRGFDLILLAFINEFSIKQVYNEIISPICLEYPDYQRQIASGLIMEFIFRKTFTENRTNLFEEDLEEAINYLKELHQIRD